MPTTVSKKKKATKTLPFEGEPSAADTLRFLRIAEEVMATPWPTSGKGRATEEENPIIGTLCEKRLHATVKRYLCEDERTHERPVADFDISEPSSGQRKNGMVADVLVDDQIFEVQTGSLYPLRKKLAWYLTHTDCSVTVVHPMAGIRYLSWIDPTDGHIVSRRKCPGRGQVKDIAKELYWISDFIGNPRFSLRILLLELEEYRMKDGWSRDGKRGSNRYERFPTALLGDIMLYEPEDFAFYFLPDTIPANTPFTAAEYAKASGIRGRATYGVLHLLVKLGVLSETEKIGRSQGFIKKSIR